VPSGAGDWRRCAANAPPAGSPPDGGTRGSIDHACRRFPGARPRERITGLVNDTRRLCSWGRTRHAGLPAPRTSSARYRARGPAGACSRGEEAQESTDPTTSPWPGRGSPRERTPEGSKASKWACRPLTGEPDELEQGSSRQRVLLQRSRGTVVPAHASGKPSGEPWQRVGSAGKAPEKLTSRRAWRRSNANPQGSRGPRERVRLLEWGKL
jgi:hypothetical protein